MYGPFIALCLPMVGVVGFVGEEQFSINQSIFPRRGSLRPRCSLAVAQIATCASIALDAIRLWCWVVAVS